ncbi:HNH homing endonuclease [Cellulophaga phage phi19:1]|uniref:HNH homing endonuclease n=1 Tax=Cellulophaga phage phi19:1 TaxID=1327970 RepID=R9ZVU4_9CAUD|nr:HNH endonuclease [Cellulophaga phage phi19:1]AGO47319.1 HNH homing endonuclease [Cellulophaga phage phi19:1]
MKNSINANNVKNEKWHTIIGYLDYEVTKCGRIRSIDRLIESGGKYKYIKGVEIKRKPTKLGYTRVKFSSKGKEKNIFLHRIIALNFIPNPENKRCVNHINGIKTDNRVENLEWCTHSENSIHAIKNKLTIYPRGEEHHHSRLILNLETGIFYNGAKQASIHSQYSYGHFKNILNGRDTNYTSFVYV